MSGTELSSLACCYLTVVTVAADCKKLCTRWGCLGFVGSTREDEAAENDMPERIYSDRLVTPQEWSVLLLVRFGLARIRWS